MAVVLNYRFAMRRRTAAGWTSLNEVLLQSEWGHESDTDRLKIGDGVTAWIDLPYYGLDTTGVAAGDYGIAVPSIVSFAVNEFGQLTEAHSAPLAVGDGLSLDVDPITGVVTLSLNVPPVFDKRSTRAGDIRVTRSGDFRIIR